MKDEQLMEYQNDIVKKYKKIEQDNINLRQKINKAIEEINYWGIDKEHNDDKAMRFALKEILNILRGEKC